jgi:hypothetical protein
MRNWLTNGTISLMPFSSMLQNAVHSVPEVHQAKMQADQQATQNGQQLSYTDYVKPYDTLHLFNMIVSLQFMQVPS